MSILTIASALCLFLGVWWISLPSPQSLPPVEVFFPMLQQLPGVGIGAFSSLYKLITEEFLTLFLYLMNLSGKYIATFSLEDVIQ